MRIKTDSHPRECGSFPDLLYEQVIARANTSASDRMMSKRCQLENRQRQSISVAARIISILLAGHLNDFRDTDRFDLCSATPNAPNDHLERDSSGPRVLELLIDIASGAHPVTLMLRSLDKYSKLLRVPVEANRSKMLHIAARILYNI